MECSAALPKRPVGEAPEGPEDGADVECGAALPEVPADGDDAPKVSRVALEGTEVSKSDPSPVAP